MKITECQDRNSSEVFLQLNRKQGTYWTGLWQFAVRAGTPAPCPVCLCLQAWTLLNLTLLPAFSWPDSYLFSACSPSTPRSLPKNSVMAPLVNSRLLPYPLSTLLLRQVGDAQSKGQHNYKQTFLRSYFHVKTEQCFYFTMYTKYKIITLYI